MRPDAVSRTNCTPGLTRRAGGQEQTGWLEGYHHSGMKVA
jgi:hypothetical protein